MDYSDEEIDAGHDIVSVALIAKLAELNEEASQLESEARGLRAEASRIRKIVEAGRWYELGGVLSESSIELMSNVEPVDRLSLLSQE
jgi:hypothetical protein